MKGYEVHPIGRICKKGDCGYIEIYPQFRTALQALEGFSHLNVVWWFSDFDSEQAGSILEVEKPYKKAPNKMGIFATRSPVRPNPLALTVVEVLEIDYEKGMIRIPYMDANDGTPLLDLKPYTPSMDRIDNPRVPEWCSHWPKSLEESEGFAWENEFNF